MKAKLSTSFAKGFSRALDLFRAKTFGTDHNHYLKRQNYRDRRVSKQRFSLDGILGTLQKNIHSEKDPIKYYRENYGTVPPWILFKGTYFSTLVNFIRLFKARQKQEIIQKIYPIIQPESNSPK
ncbi:MAG: Abi family protein [Lachnospiraceae bacterium]|nr:Abi family protein [Lachnospiraceae bacterium]